MWGLLVRQKPTHSDERHSRLHKINVFLANSMFKIVTQLSLFPYLLTVVDLHTMHFEELNLPSTVGCQDIRSSVPLNTQETVERIVPVSSVDVV